MKITEVKVFPVNEERLKARICPDRSFCCLRCGPARAEQNGSASSRQQEDQPYGISFCPDT